MKVTQRRAGEPTAAPATTPLWRGFCEELVGRSADKFRKSTEGRGGLANYLDVISSGYVAGGVLVEATTSSSRR